MPHPRPQTNGSISGLIFLACISSLASLTSVEAQETQGDVPLDTQAAQVEPKGSAPESGHVIQILPRTIHLMGPESSAQVVVSAESRDGQLDFTSQATFRIADPSVAVIAASGLVEARSEGETHITATVHGRIYHAQVVVEQTVRPPPVSFHNDVNPVLTKAGCNSGGCHGKAEGKNGFRLSLFGFDAEADHEALVKQGRGRRVSLAQPRSSLILQKGSGQIPHGGGAAVAEGSFGYRRILRWIQEGAVFDAKTEAPIDHIEVLPSERTFQIGSHQAGLRQQLRVVAHDAQGNTRDVTAESAFETNASSIAEVSRSGLVQSAGVPGEAAVLVRYMGHIAVSRMRVPQDCPDFVRPKENNFIDTLVWDKLEEMGVQPSAPCDDATFLRRASLDIIGTLPTADEAAAFLADRDPSKRARLVDRLLERSEYARYWSLLWADIMRVDANALGPQRSVAMTRWLRKQFSDNRPYDAMVREIITARGDMQRVAPTAIYASLKSPTETASAMSQLFLGVRIECAQCHHHPFERWSQQDFYALAGFFTGVKQKQLPGGGSAVTLTAARDLSHPRSGAVVPAAGLGQAAEAPSNTAGHVALPFTDRRQELADWMTEPDNPFFARAIVNRIWAHYFGRGLVEPVDDLRASNPATNEPLLAALADRLRATNYDLKEFQRTLLASQAYQLSTTVNASNAADQQYFSHAQSRTLPAEVLLDAICQVTGRQEKFNGWPLGARAIDVWDNRMPSYFFRIFGRPQRTSVCACERGNAPSITQALHLMNSPQIADKISAPGGVIDRLHQSGLSPAEQLDKLYLTMLARHPRDSERELLLPTMNDPAIDRRDALEDIMWALMNSKEFLYNH